VVDGSDCDVKKFILRDWIAIFFLIVFLIIANLTIFEKLGNIEKI